MPLSLRNYGLLLIAAFAFAQCANLREVNAFAVSSQRILDRNRTAVFGYASYSHDSTFIFNYLPDHLRDLDCRCDLAKQMDSHIASEYSILSAYFAALARFADPQAFVNFAPMSAPLPAGTYGSVNISVQEATLASRLSTALTALATTGYKAKKIPGFMATYRDSVAPLLVLLKIRADNLSGRIINLQLQLDRVADSLISFAQDKAVKMPVVFAYDAKRKELDATLAAYQARVHDLETIISGGQLIVDNIDKLHEQSFKDKMMSIVNALSANVH